MQEAEQASALIEKIYEAVLSPSLWPGVLGKCAQFVGDSAAELLSKDATFAAHGICGRDRDGAVDDEARRRLSLVVPHIRRAALIGKSVDLRTAEAASLADTLDGLSASTILVDAHAGIVHANTAGHALLAEGSVLSVRSRKLAASDASAEQALRDVLRAAGSGNAAVGTGGVAVPIASRGGERWVAHVLPLTSGARRRAGASYAAVAALLVHEAALVTPSPTDVIAKTFKLTPRELRILLAIVEVGGTSATAGALGIAESTVKTHLRNLYAKTGTGSQADLVKLVAGYASPLAGGPA